MCKYAPHSLLFSHSGQELSWSVIHIKFSFTHWGASEENWRKPGWKTTASFCSQVWWGCIFLSFSVVGGSVMLDSFSQWRALQLTVIKQYTAVSCTKTEKRAQKEKEKILALSFGVFVVFNICCVDFWGLVWSGELLRPHMLFFLSSQKGETDITYILLTMPNQKCLLIPPRHFSCCQASSSSPQRVVIHRFVWSNLPTCLCMKLTYINLKCLLVMMYCMGTWSHSDRLERSWDSLFWLLLFHIFGDKTFTVHSIYHFVRKTLHP